ncbi:MAG: DUF1801 domain-containing protein [Lishizhenia sp.]
MDTFLELFSKYNTAIKACLIGLDQLIVDFDSGNIERSIKYGSACYLLNEKMFVFVLVEKNTEKPYVLFTDGNLLEHPKLEKGNRKRMKVYYVNPSEDINRGELYELLNEMRVKSKRFN